MGGLVWLASYPRSGNTWTRNFLHNLFNVLEGRGAQDINWMHERSTWDIDLRWYRAALGPHPEKASVDLIAKARPAAHKAIAHAVDSGLMFVKTHAALINDHDTPTITFAVTAGAVYVVRNPLDVAISFAHHMGRDVDTAIRLMNLKGYRAPSGPTAVAEPYGSWSQNVESWTRKSHAAICIARYEDLHADALGEFTKIVRHLGIAATSAQIEQAVDRSSFEQLSAQEEEVTFRERPSQSKKFFRSGTVGQWREVLTKEQIDAVVRSNAPLMERFGYLP
jgi:hypothetical protein